MNQGFDAVFINTFCPISPFCPMSIYLIFYISHIMSYISHYVLHILGSVFNEKGSFRHVESVEKSLFFSNPVRD